MRIVAVISRHIVLAGAVLIFAQGCATVQQGYDKTKEVGGQVVTGATTLVTNGVNATRDKISGHKHRSSVDDGSDCFPKQKAFDDASNEVADAAFKENMAKGGVVGARYVATYSDSAATKLAAAGFSKAMAGVIADLESDRTRIENVTRTLDELVACRRQEAELVKRRVGEGKIEKDKGAARLHRVREALKDDADAARDANKVLKSRNDAYTQTAKRLKTEAPPPKDAAERKERAEDETKVDAAVQTNQRVLQQQSASVAATAKLAENDNGEFDLSWLARHGGRVLLAVLDGRRPAS